MAQAIIMDTKLKVLFENGLNSKGEVIIKTKIFSNVRKEATADQLFQAGQALASLCSLPVVNIERADNFELVNA
ncbi:DUF1659 domain-containing protein [Robertmurraya sp. FSL R5-0851]|uniref:DUF1659 domain-containing protein n=1 Tax=Robertmurraya sp. FSL R5-0851 TaxID=2921584 RepID=UPI00136F3083